mgnify:CR=1 FL=1
MNFKKESLSKLTSEMDFWRRSSRISRKEKINSIIREKMQVEKTLTDDIKIILLKWFGHVQMMKENGSPKSVLNWHPTGRRKKGRPRKS